MDLQTAFDALSRIVDRYESEKREVRRVEASAEGREGALHATMEVPVVFGRGGTAGPAESATLTDAGRLRVDFSAPETVELPETPGATVSAVTREVHVVDGELRRTVELAITPATADVDADAVLDDPPSPSRTDPPTAVRGTADADGPTVAGRLRSGDSDADPGDGRSETDSDPGSNAPDRWGGAERSGSRPGRAEDEGDDGNADADADGTADDGGAATADPLATVRDESVPPYDDVAYLRRLYDACDTFTEMSRRIEMEVAAETVRRYMIDAGIHEPTSYDTSAPEREADSEPATGTGAGSGDSDATGPAAESGPDESGSTDERDANDGGRSVPDSPEPSDSEGQPGADSIPTGRLVTDGVGLPDGLRTTDVADAVVESATLYEVQRSLGLDRERTRSLLERLDLLDLVVCRLADASEREITYDEVASRLRQCPATAT
jgi:hypothetical protein